MECMFIYVCVCACTNTNTYICKAHMEHTCCVSGSTGGLFARAQSWSRTFAFSSYEKKTEYGLVSIILCHDSIELFSDSYGT